jgi:lipopolysaccharide transport system ATP-binding protein
MSDTVIRVQGMAKRYKIGVGRPRYGTLRDRIADGLHGLFQKNGQQIPVDSIWALKDVSFEVKKGEALGIIGRNGAGKSTLLKILARITEPTLGRAEIRGRVGSLLEVGTGFHPELTGRENIYLNGAILGMRKSEIERKFDEIVAFSEVEKFIDTPVKHYSSGMYMRLAFAVAAHLEPDILVVDEVLAVGDLNFQNKCLGKMESVAKEGRTVLFISHNMGAITNLCRTAMWLDQGQIATLGDVGATVSSFIKSTASTATSDLDKAQHQGSGGARFIAIRLLDVDGTPRTTYSMGENIVVEIDADFHRSFSSLDMSVDIKQAETGMGVLHLKSQDSGFNILDIRPGRHRFSVEIPQCLLYPGSYRISLWLAAPGEGLDWVQDIATFFMVPSGCSKRTTPFYSHLGVVHSPSIWREV